MNKISISPRELLLGAGLFLISAISTRADGIPGTIDWSDGHKNAGDISLTPGKELRLFTSTAQVAVALAEVKAIRFSPEKEEMAQGFYFPNAGQATQVKTNDVYPVRYLRTQITLANGTVLEGHLFTTVFYIETDDATSKVVVMAKQTGTDGQKLADLAYPTAIHFDAGATSTSSAQIDLTQAGLIGAQPPVIVAKPDLASLPTQQVPGKPIWTVAALDPAQLLFAVQAGDGIHVAWPQTASAGSGVDPAIRTAVETALKIMQDFDDNRTLIGCFAEGDDVYSLVMLKRVGPVNQFDKKPWSLVILRWKYDADAKKVTLLNRASLATGRTEGNSAPPAVFMEPELLHAISGSKQP